MYEVKEGTAVALDDTINPCEDVAKHLGKWAIGWKYICRRNPMFFYTNCV